MKITTMLVCGAAAAAAPWALAPASATAMPIQSVKQAAAQVDAVTEVRRRVRRHVPRYDRHAYPSGYYGYAYPYGGWIPPAQGYYDPSFRNRCIYDLGYGRWESCDQ